MGSYASVYYYDSKNQLKFVALFEHKYFGYIPDEDVEKTLSYQWLMKINAFRYNICMSVNYSYIGTVLKLPFSRMLEFMALYSNDYAIYEKTTHATKFYGWDFCNIPKDSNQPVYLSFD